MAPVTSEFLSWAKQSPQKAVVKGNIVDLRTSASAHSLAHALAVHGIKQGDVVAVVGPRSFGLIASIVSVFLSGGVLLTIDRNQPIHRQRLMMSEAEVKYLIYVGDWRQEDEWLRELPVLTILHVASQRSSPANDSASKALSARGFIGRPAYIFFTRALQACQRSFGLSQSLSHFDAEEHVRYRPADRVPNDELVLRSCSPGHIPAVSQRGLFVCRRLSIPHPTGSGLADRERITPSMWLPRWRKRGLTTAGRMTFTVCGGLR
jgi:non-ribosomal peptide synthetase component F